MNCKNNKEYRKKYDEYHEYMRESENIQNEE